MMLEARDLSVRYRGAAARALDGASLAVESGTLVVLVGPNGSGKTTLMRALLGTVAAESGAALVDGRPVALWKRPELARFVGVVAQREEAWIPLTVEETVLLGRYPRLGALTPIGPEDRAAGRRALERCDMWELRQRQVDGLSGGEWQRVRLARALAQEPRALVLDEPGAALDIRHEMEVMELVRQLVDDGLGCLLITHHINLAARYADRMVLLDRGRVVASGTPDEVLRAEVVSQVFGWPIAVTQWEGWPQLVALRPVEGSRSGSKGVEGG
ncbi:MAG TPA: ABC transporter ATP-binding protein [Gemmatimonadales bacterium]